MSKRREILCVMGDMEGLTTPRKVAQRLAYCEERPTAAALRGVVRSMGHMRVSMELRVIGHGKIHADSSVRLTERGFERYAALSPDDSRR